MKRLIFLSLLIVIIQNSYGQKKINLSFYQNTDVFEINKNYFLTGNNESSKKYNFNRISIAVNTKIKKLNHEIEFVIPNFSSKIKLPMEYTIIQSPYYKSSFMSYEFRYKIGKEIYKFTESLTFKVSTGINPYYSKIENDTINLDNLNFAPKNIKTLGISINVVPELNYVLSDKWILKFNIPLKLYDFRKSKLYIDDPALQARQRTRIDQKHIFFEKTYTFQFGIGYSINKNK
ncbi:MAG: hypothetical protein ABJH05_05380 [Fulvivirga sp.]